MFMHNGFIGSWNRLRRQAEALIPDALYPARVGTTDSEAVFLAIMGAGIEQDPLAATARTLAKLSGFVSEKGEKLRFTAALANGQDLYAFRYAVNDSANSLYYRQSGGGVVIVSEPLDKDHANWTAVPDNRVVVARAGKPVEVLPFLAHQDSATEAVVALSASG
jgi:glutamine amidotransferase